jgi:hypothetical protein
MTQNQQILNHLRKGTITPLEAAKQYGIMCLAERVRDLREKGHKILTTKEKKNGKQYARYSLIKGAAKCN